MNRKLVGRVLLISLVLVLLAVAYKTGVLSQFSELATARQTLQGLGVWGYAAFVLAYTLLQPFGVPGTIFVFVAPLIWPFPIAFTLSMVGTMLASIVGFSFARYVARDWVEPRIPKRFLKYSDAIERNAFVTVALLRFVFWMPPLLHAFFGVSKVKFSTHVWGSLVGYIVPLGVTSYFGPALLEWMKQLTWRGWTLVALVYAVIALIVWGVRRWRKGRVTP